MLLLSQFDWPDAWKPIFRGLDAAGWFPEATLDQPDWTGHPLLRLRHFHGRQCYLAFLHEPIWCGNARQNGGLTVAALARELPRNRAEAEESTLLLTTDWETHIDAWIDSLPASPAKI